MCRYRYRYRCRYRYRHRYIRGDNERVGVAYAVSG